PPALTGSEGDPRQGPGSRASPARFWGRAERSTTTPCKALLSKEAPPASKTRGRLVLMNHNLSHVQDTAASRNRSKSLLMCPDSFSNSWRTLAGSFRWLRLPKNSSGHLRIMLD